MWDVAKAVMPWIGVALVGVGFVLMIVFARPATHEVMRSQYESFLQMCALIAGPTAAAYLGDIAINARRPASLDQQPPHVRRAYWTSRIASWFLFGIFGGAAAAYLGKDPIIAYAVAGGFGAAGPIAINLVFNRIVGINLPTEPDKGA